MRDDNILAFNIIELMNKAISTFVSIEKECFIYHTTTSATILKGYGSLLIFRLQTF